MNGLLTTQDIADRYGVKRITVYKWVTRHQDFPQPAENIGVARLYDPDDIAAWAKAHGKQPIP